MKRKSAVFVVLFALVFSLVSFAGEVSIPNQNIKPKLLEEFKVYSGNVLMRFTSVFTVEGVLNSFASFEKSEHYDSCINGKWFQSDDTRRENCKSAIGNLNKIFDQQMSFLNYWNQNLFQDSYRMDGFLNTVLDSKLRNFAKYQQDVLERGFERMFALLEKHNKKKVDALREKYLSGVVTSDGFKSYVEEYRNFLANDFLKQMGNVRRYLGGKALDGLEALKNYPNVEIKKDASVVRICGLSGNLMERFLSCSRRLDMNQSIFISSVRENVYSFKEKIYHWFLVGQNRTGDKFWRDNTSGLVWTNVSKQKMGYEAARTYCRMQTPDFDFNSSHVIFDLPTRDQFEGAYSRGFNQLFNLAKNEQWAKPDEKSMLTMEWAWAFEGEKGSSNVVGGEDLLEPRYVRCVGQAFR